MDVNFPSNANYMFKLMREVVTIDIFPSKDTLSASMDFGNQKPFNMQFDSLDIF